MTMAATTKQTLQQAGLAALRVVMGGLFLYAAATKVPDMAAFAEDIANYRMMPASLISWVAPAVVGVELAAGLAMVSGVWARAGAWIVAVMLAVFMVGLSQALLRGIDLRCGCFGGSETATWGTVARDAAMLAATAIVIWRGPGRLLWFIGARRADSTASAS